MSESIFPISADQPTVGYNSAYGVAVAVSSDGSTVAFSSNRQSNESGATNAGLVQVYTRNSNVFTLKGSNILGNQSQQLGRSLALNQDGTVIFVGGNSQLLIYEYDGSDWTPLLTLGGSQSNGSAVAITADAKYMTTFNNSSLLLYEKDSNANTYTEIASINPSSLSNAVPSIGYDGSTTTSIRILLGQPNYNVPSSNTGSAELFSYNDSTTLLLSKTFSTPIEDAIQWGSGVSMTSDAKRFAIGSVSGGIVQVYDDDGSGTNYVQFGSNITGTASYRFGSTVALSSTTNYLMIGSEYFDTGSSSTAVGRVNIYVPSGSEYVEDTSFGLTGTTEGLTLGTTVAVDALTTIIASGGGRLITDSVATLTQDSSMCLVDSSLVPKMVEL